MSRFGILLDSGAVLPLPARIRRTARAYLSHYRESRRIALADRELAVPRRAIGLVIYRSPKP